MKRLIILALPLLAGCPSMSLQDMSADQLRATNGMVSCSQLSSIYGKGSNILVNADQVSKGATSKGKTIISCGDATMTVESEIGVPVPPGATTTTTTVVKPANE